jgi:hypothetical protein
MAVFAARTIGDHPPEKAIGPPPSSGAAVFALT